jgi:hypothetical protein
VESAGGASAGVESIGAIDASTNRFGFPSTEPIAGLPPESVAATPGNAIARNTAGLSNNSRYHSGVMLLTAGNIKFLMQLLTGDIAKTNHALKI